MARIDKTDSAIGVQRGRLAVDWAEADVGVITPVGINSSGLIVKGAGQTGVIGVVVLNSIWDRYAGTVVDILSLGELVEVTGLAAGTAYYSDAAGVVSTTNTGKYIGYTIEADRLVVRMP